jgi:predicted metal-dependent phosphoesterase TrpH
MKLDLHVHSFYSRDAIGSPKDIIKYVKKRGLNGIAITDHNTIKGSIEALKHSSENFIVIPGLEVSTSDGHLIALNVKKNIKNGLSLEETIENIINLGGIPIVPHLFRSLSGIKKEKLKKIHNKISAIEVFNSCCPIKNNIKTAGIAEILDLGGTGGSDSHIPEFAGYGYSIIDTNDLCADEIIDCIKNKKTWGEGQVLSFDYRIRRVIKSIKQYFQHGFKRI